MAFHCANLAKQQLCFTDFLHWMVSNQVGYKIDLCEKKSTIFNALKLGVGPSAVTASAHLHSSVGLTH